MKLNLGPLKPPLDKINEKYEKNYIENHFKKNMSINNKKNAIDLIKKLLELNVDKRIDVDEALDHSFFNN